MKSPLFPTENSTDKGRAILNLLGGALWHIPGCFDAAGLLGSRYSLRCVLFHDVSDTQTWLTRGLGVTICRRDFENALTFITRHYTPVTLQDILDNFAGRPVPKRPVLLTFDDAYASVREVAAPLCAKFDVPAVFFVNGQCLDNRSLALDNIVCYVANRFGIDAVNAAIRKANGGANLQVRTLYEVFSIFLPNASVCERDIFRKVLLEDIGTEESDLAKEAGIYLSSQQLRQLAGFRFEIGDHTYSHANCRSLSETDFRDEIERNRNELESISGARVRSFSVPYGSIADLTPVLVAHLRHRGYEASFLSESRVNTLHADPFRLNRISIKTGEPKVLFSEIEVLPRMRFLRDLLKTAVTIVRGPEGGELRVPRRANSPQN